MIYTISSDKLTAKINSVGAELISLSSKTEEYIWQGGVWKEHAPLLFPACGRLVGNTYTLGGKSYEMGIHGFARKLDYMLHEISDNRIVLILENNDETYASFPFEWRLIVEYVLTGSTLKANFTVFNNDERVMPFMFGWHPGFTLWGDIPMSDFVLDFGDTCCVTHHLCTDTKFISGAVEAYPLEGGKYKVNPEEIYAQDTFVLSDTLGKVTLSSPKSERELTITWSDNLPYIAIWSWPYADARYICLEPWSGLPGDGVTPEVWENRINISLASGDSETFSYTVECK